MTDVLELRGGARIGRVSSSWPFARLVASAHRLSVSGALLGHYRFSPEEVVSFDPCGSIPVVSSGIRIVHTNPAYPERIVFWCFREPELLIAQIAELGFRPQGSAAPVARHAGFALRGRFVAVGVVALLALFALDSVVRWPRRGPGMFSLLAVALLFLGAIALVRSSRLQRLALKRGRSLSEIRALLAPVHVVGGVLLALLAASYLVA
jgi:hypothetical protein